MSLAGFPAVLFLILILKWTYAKGKSLVERTPTVGSEDEYGTLIAVAEPNNHIEGEILRQRLIAVESSATEKVLNSG